MTRRRDLGIAVAFAVVAVVPAIVVPDPAAAMAYATTAVGFSAAFAGHAAGSTNAAEAAPKGPVKWLGAALALVGIALPLLGAFSLPVETALRLVGTLGIGLATFALADAPDCLPDEEGAVDPEARVAS